MSWSGSRGVWAEKDLCSGRVPCAEAERAVQAFRVQRIMNRAVL